MKMNVKGAPNFERAAPVRASVNPGAYSNRRATARGSTQPRRPVVRDDASDCNPVAISLPAGEEQ